MVSRPGPASGPRAAGATGPWMAPPSPPTAPLRLSDAVGSRPKLSLGFILHEAPGVAVTETVTRQATTNAPYQPYNAANSTAADAKPTKKSTPVRLRASSRKKARSAATRLEAAASAAPSPPLAVARTSQGSRRARGCSSQTSDEKRLARKCTVDGCANYTINKGLCFRHGGGKQCSLEGCAASAKIAGRCWKHGGSIQCVVDGCDRRGKSRGLCWTHGGGTACGHDECTKVAVSKGYCWAHGGGKRCLFDGCERPAYARTFNYCPKHFERFENGDEIMEV